MKPPSNERFYAIPFNLVTGGQATALTANENRQGLVVEGDPDKEMWITHIGIRSTGRFTIHIKNSDDDGFMTKNPIDSAALQGPLDRQGLLPRPIRLRAKASLTLEVKDLSGAANDVFLTFLGYRLHNAGC